MEDSLIFTQHIQSSRSNSIRLMDVFVGGGEVPELSQGMEDPEDETFKLTTEDGKLKVEKEKVKAAKAKEIEADVIFDQPPQRLGDRLWHDRFLSFVFLPTLEFCHRVNSPPKLGEDQKNY